MDILFQASYPLNPQAPQQSVLDRIRAKRELWAFLEEVGPEVLAASNNEDVAGEIISATIRLLHPHYTGLEIMQEARLILISMRMEVPNGFTALFADSFGRIVAAKIRTAMRKDR